MSHTTDLPSSALVAPRRTRVVLDAGPVHVTELGPPGGTPLIFLHGVLANAQLWLGVAQRLSANHRCLLFDLPLGAHAEAMEVGADLSPEGVAALVIAVLDKLGIPGAGLASHGWRWPSICLLKESRRW